MSKLAVMIAASALALAVASPALAASKHHHRMVEPQPIAPTGALIGGAPVKQSGMCLTVRSADWGAGYYSPCAK